MAYIYKKKHHGVHNVVGGFYFLIFAWLNCITFRARWLASDNTGDDIESLAELSLIEKKLACTSRSHWVSGEDFPTLDGVYLQSGAGKGRWWGEGDRAPYLLSSLNHWNSADGTAEASHCSVPFCPTGTPVPLASDMYGGSAERRRSMPFNSTLKNENKQTSNKLPHSWTLFPNLCPISAHLHHHTAIWTAPDLNTDWVPF